MITMVSFKAVSAKPERVSAVDEQCVGASHLTAAALMMMQNGRRPCTFNHRPPQACPGWARRRPEQGEAPILSQYILLQLHHACTSAAYLQQYWKLCACHSYTMGSALTGWPPGM